MATVYSLICWGGATGKSITLDATAATNDEITLTNHGLLDATAVRFTSGTLPTGLALNTTYYSKSTASNKFKLYSDSNLTTQVTWSGTGTSAILKSKYYTDLSDKTRWTYSSVEYIYETISAVKTALFNLVTVADDLYIELGEGRIDYDTGNVSLQFLCNSLTIHSYVNGVRSSAFHNGVLGSGYVISYAGSGTSILLNMSNITIDGISTNITANNSKAMGTSSLAYNVIFRNNLLYGNTSATGQKGAEAITAGDYYNNIITKIGGDGINIASNSGFGARIYNNLITKCTGTGVLASTSTQGRSYNNISVGNTTANWGKWPTASSAIHAYNFGEAADKLTITVDYATNANNITFSSAHGLTADTLITFTTTGTLPNVTSPSPTGALTAGKTYFVKTVVSTTVITICHVQQGTVIAFSDNGSGTHYSTRIWSSYGTEEYLDLSTNSGNDVFVNYANDDYRPAGSAGVPNAKALQVNAGILIGTYQNDMLGLYKPDYESTTYPNNLYDVGPHEFNHGEGNTPPTTVTISNLVAGSTVRVYTTGTTTVLASTASSGTSYSIASVTGTVDYTILKAGYIPIRVVGAVFADGLSFDGTQTVDRAYISPSGLTLDTNCYIDTSTKKFGLTTTSTLQNFYSYMIDRWVALGDAGEELANVSFPIQANGPNSFTFLNGWEWDLTGYSASITNLSRDGLRYVNASGTTTASWAAILTVGVSSGMRVKYQQSDGGTTQSAAVTSGNMDELVQIYGDSSHGNFDYTGYLVLKVQEMGYDQAEADAVALYGTLEDQLYVVGLVPTANGVATGNPSLANPPTITDHAGSPVTWNSKEFSITIEDSAAGNTGTDIMKWLRYYFETGGTFQSKDAFNWHDLVQTNGSNFKTVRGKVYGDTGASLKGVRVIKNGSTDSHDDFDLHTADDGTTYAPPAPPAALEAAVLANSRVQLYNVTTDAEIDNVENAGTTYSYVISTEASVGDVLRLRVCKLGYEPAEAFGVWAAGGVTLLVTQVEDEIYTAWGIDGSTVTEFALDIVGNIEIDADDVDGSTQKTRLGAWYNWVLTQEDGIRYAYGAITPVAVNAIRINVDVVDLTIDNVSATALIFTDTDVRLYRSDGTSVISSVSGSIHNDYSGVPDVVETGVSGLTASESNQLFAIPTESTGLTAEQSAQLMKTLTVPKFLGLK